MKNTPGPADSTRPAGRASAAHGSPSRPARIGSYRILELLGQGGQGAVYLAEDERLGRQVALKVLTRVFGELSANALHRFRREAEATARLEHPGICVVYETGEADGVSFIAMRRVEGESLATRLESLLAQAAPRGRSSSAPSTQTEINEILELVERVARALEVAHEAGVVHRDIKPANIMVTPSGQPVVLDFGLAHIEQDDEAGITRSGDFMGTPAYMSPEQLAASRIKVDRRSDIYSLGVTLYECLTLRRPFEKASLDGLYKAILGEEPPDPRKLNSSVTADLRVVLETALYKDRDRRYHSALAFAEDLRRVRQGEPIQARPIRPLERVLRWGRRHPSRVAIWSLGILAFCVAPLVLATILYQENAETRLAENHALERAQEALSQRAQVDELVAFMMGDLYPRLAEIGRVELLEAVAIRAEEHFSNRVADGSPEDLRKYSALLGSVAWIRRSSQNPSESLRVHRKQLAILTELAADGGVAADRAALAGCHLHIGEDLRMMLQLPESQQEVETSLRLFEALPESASRDRASGILECHIALGQLAVQRGLNAAALEHFNRARELAEEPGFETSRVAILALQADVHAAAGDEAAELAARQARRELLTLALEVSPDDARALGKLADCVAEVARLLMHSPDTGAAREAVDSSAAIFGRLLQQSPADAHARQGLAVALFNRGELFRQGGQLEEAVSAFQDARTQFERLVAIDPENLLMRYNLAQLLGRLGEVLVLLRDAGGAREAYEQSGKQLRELLPRNPENATWHADLAAAEASLGLITKHLGEQEVALAHYDLAVQQEREAARLDERRDDVLQALIAQRDMQARRVGLLLGTLEPENALEHIELAMAMHGLKRHVDAATHYRTGLSDPDLDPNRRLDALYNGACLASLASQELEGAAAETWREQALEWLTEHLQVTHSRIQLVHDRLDVATDPAEREKLAHSLNWFRGGLEHARSVDPDLQAIRGLPGFEALFPSDEAK